MKIELHRRDINPITQTIEDKETNKQRTEIEMPKQRIPSAGEAYPVRCYS